MRIIAIILWLYVPLMAFPPNLYFQELLQDNGEISQNTLKYQNKENFDIFYQGEIMLTGVIERRDNNDIFVMNDEIRFYPDSNLVQKFPFTYNSFGSCANDATELETYGALGCKDLEPLKFGILLDVSEVTLPRMLQKRIFGIQSARILVRLKNYRFYGEGDAGFEASATLDKFIMLSSVKKKYHNLTADIIDQYAQFTCQNKESTLQVYKNALMDDEVIDEISCGDVSMRHTILLSADCQANSFCKDDEMVAIYYFRTTIKDAKEVRYGYVQKELLQSFGRQLE